MEITEVRIKLMEDTDDRLAAFCSITLDHCFVVRDLKIISGANGPFVAMPSRKLTAHCPRCGCKNHLRAAYCNQCGGKLKDELIIRDHEGRTKLYADIAHPINSGCREMIQSRVISEFEAELERAKEPGYISRYDEGYDADAGEEGGLTEAPPQAPRSKIEPAATEPRPPHRPTKGRPQGGTSSSGARTPNTRRGDSRADANRPASRRGDDAPSDSNADDERGSTGDTFGEGIF